jgi:hypothetical protein
MIQPLVKLTTINQFALNEKITYKTAISWMIKSDITPYTIGESKRQNSNGKWSCFVIALDDRMMAEMRKRRVK